MGQGASQTHGQNFPWRCPLPARVETLPSSVDRTGLVVLCQGTLCKGACRLGGDGVIGNEREVVE